MKEKKKPLYTLLSLLIVLALTVPVWSTAVRADTPMPIWDWHDLYDIRSNLSGTYILMNDLDSSTPGYADLAGAAANDGKGWEPIGNQPAQHSFTGSFDGQGYEIADLYINRPAESNIGLFCWVGSAGTVGDVGIVRASVTGESYAGGLVGLNHGTVSNSHSGGSVTGNEHVGGLVGVNHGAVSNSHSGTSVTGNSSVGGLVGMNWGQITNSYATGSVAGDYYVGGLVAWLPAGDVSNSYSTGHVDCPTGAGGLVGHSAEGTVSNCFWDTETSGQATSAGGTPKTTAEMKDIVTFTGAGWEITGVTFGTTNPAYTWNIVDGRTYPFLNWEPPGHIRNWYDLDAVRNNLSGDYTLMNDLDSTTAGYDELAGPDADEGKGWQPIGTSANRFTGSFDGQDFEITDLVIDRPGEDYPGLFGWVAAIGVVANAGIANASVTGNSWVGTLVGVNFGSVISSYASGSVTGNERVGGLMGENIGTVSHSHSTGGVSATSYAGGLVGTNFASVSNSHSSGSVTGNNDVGGLVGRNDSTGTVSTSRSSGSVTGHDNVGGLVGLNWNEATVVMSYASGSVTGSMIVGGMVGRNDGTVNESYATGAVTRSSGTSSSFGGFVGWNNRGRIINCYSTGSVHFEDEPDPDDRGFAGSITEGDGYEMTGNFWDIETSGQATTLGQATGMPTEDMMDITTFIDAGWDIAAVVPGTTNPAFIWNIIHGRIYPFLSWQDPLGKPVAVLGDYESQLLDLLISRSFMAEHRGWDIIGDVGQYSAVVINLPTDPGAATFIEFLDEADQYGVGVVFLHQRVFGDPWGVTLLHNHLNDPTAIYSSGFNDVYYEVLQEHPIFEGWQVGDIITLIDSGPRDCSWFDDYSGDIIADLGYGSGISGRGVGVGAYGQSTHVLLASLGVGTALGGHIDHWTEDARTIFINAISLFTYPSPGSRIHGTTYDVVCAELDEVTIRLYKDGVFQDETISGPDGNYTIWAGETGLHTLVASKDGFRPETRWVNVEDLEAEYEFNFAGNHGLIPDAPDLFYVLDCIDLWLYPPGDECGLTLFRVLDVIDAWLYPIIETE